MKYVSQHELASYLQLVLDKIRFKQRYASPAFINLKLKKKKKKKNRYLPWQIQIPSIYCLTSQNWTAQILADPYLINSYFAIKT